MSDSRSPARKTDATTGKRIGAYCLDVLIWGTALLIGLAMVLGEDMEKVFPCFLVLFPLVFMVINTIMEIGLHSTLGKMCLGMYVTGKFERRLTGLQIFMRNVVKVLGIFTFAFSEKGEMLHDRMADTTVYARN